jgi:cobalt-zinc-cadmium efflux system membrane fusion protein
MKKIIILLNIAIFSMLFSCGNKQEAEEINDNDLVEITQEQFISENMVMGNVKKVLMEESLNFNGKIVANPQGIATISAPVEGIVRSINVKKGDFVNANTTIIEIGGNALIDLQQSYTSSAAKLKRTRSDYDRIKILYDDNISSEKEFLLAESEYKAELANYSGLKLKLLAIGLNLSEIENGHYVSVYGIKSPISGQISMIDCTLGQYLLPENEVVEVTDKNKVELQLDIFEKDYPKIVQGEKVVFRGVDDTYQNFSATITRVGNKIESGSSTITCFGIINPTNSERLAINQLVSGKIAISADSVFAVPQSALLTSGESKYVLVKTGEENGKIYFRRERVTTGRTEDDYVELINADISESIIISGTYNLN